MKAPDAGLSFAPMGRKGLMSVSIPLSPISQIAAQIKMKLKAITKWELVISTPNPTSTSRIKELKESIAYVVPTAFSVWYVRDLTTSAKA